MICNCKNSGTSGGTSPRIGFVQGNAFRLGIPLEAMNVTLQDGKVSTEKTSFYPNEEYPVQVTLYKGKVKYTFDASVDGNVVSIVDNGNIVVGTYSIEVLCHNQAGEPCRFMARNAVRVVDATADAGIEPGVEFDAESYMLDGGVFIFAKGDKGDPGRGITSLTVAESQESGGTNVVTITFTDGTSITFNVKNGERGEGVTQETLERIATALQDAEKASSLATSAAAMAEQAAAHVTPHVSLSEEAYEELVNNDEVDPNTIYMTYEE